MTKNLSNRYLLFIIGVIGFIFLRSSWGKITGGQFVNTLAGTLEKFASKNPYPLVQSFLKDIAIPNSTLFGLLTMWGEFLVAIALIASALYIAFSSKYSRLIIVLWVMGLVGGMILNATFWLASGYTSPSTDGLNLIMFFVELTGLVYALRLLKTRLD